MHRIKRFCVLQLRLDAVKKKKKTIELSSGLLFCLVYASLSMPATVS